MHNPFIARLKYAAPLTDGDVAQLNSACQRTRIITSRQDIIQEGDRPETVHLILEGFACRYKMTREGNRQIIGVLLPGDLSDLHGPILDRIDYNIGAVSECTIADIPYGVALRLMDASPGIKRALWWCTLADQSILREWLVNMGQRPTDQGVAHLMCELLLRLQAVGLADEAGYDMLLRQNDVAEALGATAVHVNRVVQALRRDKLICWKGRRLIIPDAERLKEFCGFTPNYLHLMPKPYM